MCAFLLYSFCIDLKCVCVWCVLVHVDCGKAWSILWGESKEKEEEREKWDKTMVELWRSTERNTLMRCGQKRKTKVIRRNNQEKEEKLKWTKRVS